MDSARSTGKSKFNKLIRVAGVILLAAVVLIAGYVTLRLLDDRPVTYANIEDHFKHGSTGGERGWYSQFGFGIPYWMWIALPEIFPEHLPDGRAGRGYSSLGMVYEEGKDPRFDLPIGMSMRRRMGIDRVYFNCSVCHTGTVRAEAGATPQIVLGMPANTLNFGALGLFLSNTAHDLRFRPRYFLPKIRQLEELREKEYDAGDAYLPDGFNFIDRAIFNYLGVYLMRDQLIALMGRLSFIDFASWGPGRVDTFNAPKPLLGFDMRNAHESELMGNADFPSVWNQKYRKGMWLHWDGNNCSVDERNLSAGFGTGATPPTIDRAGVLRTADWLWTDAQPLPFPQDRINKALIQTGEQVYRRACWQCHGNGKAPFRAPGDGSRVGAVTPIGEIGTDRARLDSYTPVLASAQGSLYAGFPEAGEAECREYAERVCDPAQPDEEFFALREQCYPYRFSHFRKTYGYANMPLDGLWLRAPYLHNGSVPTLRQLLEPSTRPAVFYTGYDVYDYANVGFVTTPCCTDQVTSGCVQQQAGACVPPGQGWEFRTSLRGNGNQGHTYGADLTPAEKDALLEYLKTL